MIESKTGWSGEEVLDRVGTQVTTLGNDGVRILRAGEEPIELPAARNVTAVEPTGVGDAFRAGFLGALTWGVGLERAAQVGCVLAAYVVETVGTQEYSFTADEFLGAARGVVRRARRPPTSRRTCAAPALGVRRRVAPRRLGSRRTTKRGVPSSAASSPTYSCAAHPAPGRDVDPRGQRPWPPPRSCRPTGTSARCRRAAR